MAILGVFLNEFCQIHALFQAIQSAYFIIYEGCSQELEEMGVTKMSIRTGGHIYIIYRVV